MTNTHGEPALSVVAREIPVPRSISEEARTVLAMGPIPQESYPDVSDIDAWRQTILDGDEIVIAMMGERVADAPVATDLADLGGVPSFRIVPDGVDPESKRVYLSMHGGALIMGGGEACRIMSVSSATRVGAVTWAPDYRMPPDHPYPAGLDDCVAAYRALLEDHEPGQIVIGGESAGGNLAAALILRARDEGLPLPTAAVLVTPEVDLTESGDSFSTNMGIDMVLTQSLMPANLLYAAGHDLADPYLSPLFGDFGRGFPPTFLSTGTRDLFLSNAVRMHRAIRNVGVHVELHVLEAASHGGFLGMAPEDDELDAEIRRFVDERWSAAGC